MFFPILLGVWLLSLTAIPHLLLARKRPTATLAWVWAVLLFPGVGALAYFAFGAERMRRKRIRKAARVGLPRHDPPPEVEGALKELPDASARLVRWLSAINQIPVSTAEEVKLLVNAREFYPALERAIDGARHHVHLEFFIWNDDECGRGFLARLVAAAQRGVKVRLLLDQMGCLAVKKSFFDPLVAAGGQMAWFYSLPLWKHSRFMNLRNHRKLQIIDGTVAFVGGMNIGREYLGRDPDLGEWCDAQMRVRGNVVTFLQEVFATDWFFATDERFDGAQYFPEAQADGPHVVQVVAGGPDIPREPIPKTLVALLGTAKKRVWITTGYFVPNTLFLTALQMAAARGVDVRLVVSEKTDHRYLVQIGRSFYEELLAWGVRVFEFSRGINHKKSILIDDDWLMIGSANADNRSMRLNFELNLFAHAPAEAKRLEELLCAEFDASTEIDLKDFKQRPFRERLIEAAYRPLAPLL